MSSKITATITTCMNAVDWLLVLLAQLILAAMMMMTFCNVVARTFFNVSIPDGLIISEMMMVAIVFLPLSYVQSVGAHLEVTVLTDLFNKKVQRLLYAGGLVLGIVVFGHMAWLGGLSAYDSFQSGAYDFSSALYIPEWPTRMLIPLGLGWWCLRMATQLLLPGARPKVADNELHQALHEAGVDAGDDGSVRRIRPGEKR